MSKLNTNSNTYIIIYSTFLVLIVAALLAGTYVLLKGRQDANVQLDTQKQILYSLNLRDSINGATDQQIVSLYKDVVKDTLMENDEKGKPQPKVYKAVVNGDSVYVLPLKGQGMWGGISAFLAVSSDKNTIYGAYFNHEGETAGLGAEIKDNAAWQKKFQGKTIFAADNDTTVALSVEKVVSDAATTVDAVTGATVTSTAVSKMLQDQLKNKYMDFLKN